MRNNRLRVDAFTTGRNDPSARFRVRQYIDPLCDLGIDVHEHIPVIDKNSGIPSQIEPYTSVFPQATVQLAWQGLKLACHLPGLAKSLRSDLIWLNREILPGRYSLERLLMRPIILDVDDAVWLAKPNGFETMRHLGSEAVAIMVGNKYLADWFSQWNSNIQIVPTAIDTDRFAPATIDNTPPRSQAYTVGWTGLSANFIYMYAIEKPLNAFLEKYDAKLLIISDREPKFQFIKQKRIDFRRWSQESEASLLREMDVGLMPLPSSDWARGKCSFKMLQYMSTAIPVVVSPIGMNIDILSHGLVGYAAESNDDWFDALNAIYQDRQLALEMGKTGHNVIIENYSRRLVSEKIANIFHSLS